MKTNGQRPRILLLPIARLGLALITFAWLASTPARAQLTIEIVGGGGDQIPITVLPLSSEDKFQQRISEVVAADLSRSGRFWKTSNK